VSVSSAGSSCVVLFLFCFVWGGGVGGGGGWGGLERLLSSVSKVKLDHSKKMGYVGQ